MENKKKYIIAIILFIFLGLTIFTFANPKKEEIKEQGSGESIKENVDKSKDGEDSSKNNTNINTNVENSDNSNNVNSHGVNVEGLVHNTFVNEEQSNGGVGGATVDDSYELALRAVIEAEEKIDENSVKKAQDLVDKVEDQSKKNELQNRLDEVKDELDVKGLVESLKNQTKSAKSKAELDNARDFRKNKEIVKKVTDLTNENLKDELNSTLEELARLLDDTTAPKLNVENGKLYNKFVKVEAKDEEGNGAQVVIKDSEGNVVDSITKDGSYTITATDDAYNTVTVTITVDTTAPKAEFSRMSVLGGTGNEKSVNVGKTVWVYVRYNEKLASEPKITIAGVEAKVFLNDKNEDESRDVYYLYVGEVVLPDTLTDGQKITFTVTDAYDEAGNMSDDVTSVTEGNVLVVDRKAPSLVVDTINENGYSNTQDPQVHATDVNPFKTIVKLDGKVVREDTASENADGTYSTWFGIGYLDDGEYEVTSVDEAGNITDVIDFILDRNNPSYNSVGIMNIDQKTEGYAKVGDRVWVYVVTDEHLSKEPIIKINGVEAKIVQTEDGKKFDADWYKYVGEVVMTEDMEEGEIQFTISDYCDLAGNKGQELNNSNINKGLEKIILDKTAPVITLDTYNNGLTNDKTVNIKDANEFSYIIRKNGKDDVRPSTAKEDGTQFARFDVWQGDGEYTIIATDLAGNTSELSFTLDTKPMTVNGIVARVFGNNNTSNNTLAKIGDRIQVVIDIAEELEVMPSLSINGETIKFSPTAGTNETHFVYEANYIVKAGDNVKNDEIVSFEVINLNDNALNGVNYNNKENTTKLNNTDFNVIKYDIVAPNASVNGKKINDGETITFKSGTSIDSRDINKYVIFGRNINGSRDGQIDQFGYRDRFNMGWLGEGTYSVSAMDEAGNEIKFSVIQTNNDVASLTSSIQNEVQQSYNDEELKAC